MYYEANFRCWIKFLSIFCYFRRGRGTSLFISRSLASRIDTLARSAKSRSDSFALGAFSVLPELPFTFPLFIKFYIFVRVFKEEIIKETILAKIIKI